MVLWNFKDAKMSHGLCRKSQPELEFQFCNSTDRQSQKRHFVFLNLDSFHSTGLSHHSSWAKLT